MKKGEKVIKWLLMLANVPDTAAKLQEVVERSGGGFPHNWPPNWPTNLSFSMQEVYVEIPVPASKGFRDFCDCYHIPSCPMMYYETV